MLSRKKQADPALRAQALTTMLCQTGQLSGAIRIPDTVGTLVVTADLHASKVTCHVDVDAPREGRHTTTRVNWLVQQLKVAPDSVRVETFTAHGRGSSAAELLGAVRQDPSVLVVDAAKEICSFRLALSASMGTKRGRGRGSFIDSVLGATDTFYADVLQSLKAWSAAPPKLRQPGPTPPDAEETKPHSLNSTEYSSQDGAEPEPASTLPDEAQASAGNAARDDRDPSATASGAPHSSL